MTSLLSEYLDEIKKLINESSMPSRRVNHEDSLAQYGCEKDTILVQNRNGDFHQFGVKVLESVKPLFTDRILLDGLDLYTKEEFDAIVRLFRIKDELLMHGYSVIDYTIMSYLKANKLSIEKKIVFDYVLEDVDARMKLTRSDAIQQKLEIVNIGNGVVPSEWIGRQFDSADLLHKEIDTLDHRKGCPPVTYCCIYSMTVTEQKNVQLVKSLSKSDKTTVWIEIHSGHKAILLKGQDDIKTPCYVELTNETHRVIIAFDPSAHFVSDLELEKNRVGLLSSTLQKCIRHGRCSTALIQQTVTSLARSKPYNLPEQQYMKVSGSRQLFWRLFITVIEDMRYYEDSTHLSLFDLLVFSLVCHKESNYIISDQLLEKVVSLVSALTLCDAKNDYHEWRNYAVSKPVFSLDSIPQTTIFIADGFVPKMSGDGIMIQRYATLLKTYIPLPLIPNQAEVICRKCEKGWTPKYTGVDIHCYPNMILFLQGSIRELNALTREKNTTQEVSRMIWDLNSKYNNRRPEQFVPEMFDSNVSQLIHSIQKDYWGEYSCKVQDQTGDINLIEKESSPTSYQKRSLFLKLFGQKRKVKSKRILEVIFHVEDLFRIKYVNGEEFLKDDDYVRESVVVWKELIANPIEITLPDCLVGYGWKVPEKIKKVTIGVSKEKKPYVSYDKTVVELDWFDGSAMVRPISVEEPIEPTKEDRVLIRNLLRVNQMGNLFQNNWIARHSIRTSCIRLREDSHPLFRSVLVKIYTAQDHVLEISHVTRNGEKVDQSVDDQEGVIWSLMNLLHYCYPKAITVSGELSFRIHPHTSQYRMLLDDLDVLCERTHEIGNDELVPIETKSVLWSHQQDTVEFIRKNVEEGKRGFGDASHVGAGKTLSALCTIAELYRYNKTKRAIALVLLPTDKLYKTWRDEIGKHFGNSIGLLEQQANGTLIGKESEGLTIVITTMGRNREHLLEKKWLFVVIDECLTVQNKEAQHTMAAWIQTVHSKFGVLLLSATFFRTRFDKLLYMLNMLQCDLPVTKDYLDTILCDSIKVHLPKTKRVWSEEVIRFELSKEVRVVYDSIKTSDLSNEMKYVRLQQLIREKVDYISQFKSALESVGDKKALIYAESKVEAEAISKTIANVGLYPDITKKHVVVSYANGTYGLNDLVGCYVMITRPPEPDKLPQMKGRLDRPGQKHDELSIKYLVMKDTVEEATYLRIDLCSRFYQNHIMPLGDFYQLALTKQ
jgi:hypothetical protein